MTKTPDVSRPLKIVRVIARLNIGGPARHVIYLAEKMNHGSFRTVLVKGAESKTEGTMEDKLKSELLLVEMSCCPDCFFHHSLNGYN